MIRCVVDAVEAVGPGRLTDWLSIGVLASSVPRDTVDEAIVATGKQAKRSDGRLPPHVMVYFAMAMALFADEDYEEVAARLSDTLVAWGCWDQEWAVPTSGGITQARQRLGYEPLRQVFERVAVPVADELTRGAWLGSWRLMAVDGFEWDAPATEANTAEFGHRGSDVDTSTYPKVRVVTISECGSHAVVAAQIGPVNGKGSGEQSLVRRLYPGLECDWLLIADRNFYDWAGWCAAADTGAALLWRAKADLLLPAVRVLSDGSYLSVVVNSSGPGRIRGGARQVVIDAAAAGEDLDPARARLVRVVEYSMPDRGENADETIRLMTTLTDPAQAPAHLLAQAYHERWEHETGNRQLKTSLRGPGRVLRSKSPDMVRQEIYGYLLTHYAISALICQAATAADIDPDRVKFTRTVRVVRRRLAGPAAFSP